MEKLYKTLAVFDNLANMAAGIAVAIILLFKTDFISVFYLNSMTTNESLFFNLGLFQVGLLLVGIVLCVMSNEDKKTVQTIEFPVFYELIPVAVSVIGIIFGLRAETGREKLLVCGIAVLYSIFSAVIIYCGARIFQTYEKK